MKLLVFCAVMFFAVTLAMVAGCELTSNQAHVEPSYPDPLPFDGYHVARDAGKDAGKEAP